MGDETPSVGLHAQPRQTSPHHSNSAYPTVSNPSHIYLDLSVIHLPNDSFLAQHLFSIMLPLLCLYAVCPVRLLSSLSPVPLV